MYENLLLGKAGELRVCSELMKRGMNAYLTMADSGIDIVTDYGAKLQVKSSRPRTDGSYTFSFNSWKDKPHLMRGVDFVVLWAVERDDFLIIPIKKIRGKRSVSISLSEYGKNHGRPNKYAQYINKWKPLLERNR